MREIKIRLPDYTDDVQYENIMQKIHDALNKEEIEDEDENTVMLEFPAHKEGDDVIVISFPEKEEEEYE